MMHYPNKRATLLKGLTQNLFSFQTFLFQGPPPPRLNGIQETAILNYKGLYIFLKGFIFKFFSPISI
uniref:Uncharacterized protein n=1 Tax=Anguilla anguilla TaxID=7936 RepID=A0A0E9WNG7_ANGAN